MLRDSCGLGFDASTNTLKMVCVLCKSNMVSDNPDVVKKDLCTMVHVLGTNSWREIPQVPSYPITAKAVFVKGCLHWLVSDLDVQTDDGGRPVIWFDVEKEEFGLIDPPKRMCDLWRKYSCRYQVVDLNGEVGYVCTKTMEFWLLNHKKEWVPHCRFKEEIVPDGYIDVMGCWNKDGDILIKINSNGSYASGVLHKTNIARTDDALSPKFIMYPNKLSSIHGLTRTMEFWLLNHKKEWMPHCRFAKEITPKNAYIYVMGCWNKDGDILIKSNSNESQTENILESFKLIVKGKVFWARAKELFVWSPSFKDVPEKELFSDDESAKINEQTNNLNNDEVENASEVVSDTYFGDNGEV
ncbi:F-box domain containing protein [Tanacetum coccineum]